MTTPTSSTRSRVALPVPGTMPGRVGRGEPRTAASGGRVSVVPVRLQEFWSRMEDQFGSMRAQTVARDHVFSVLGGRTALDAIEAGLPVRRVWLAVCEEYEVPARER
jgi:hypothetical protein